MAIELRNMNPGCLITGFHGTRDENTIELGMYSICLRIASMSNDH